MKNAAKIRFWIGISVLIGLLILTNSVLGMASSNYRLDWFVPLTGGGGGSANSTNYSVDVTIGQAVIGDSTSPQAGAKLGFWPGILPPPIFLPLVMR